MSTNSLKYDSQDNLSVWDPCTIFHHSDVIMGSKITGVSIVYSTVCSDADQSSASLAFVRGIHCWLVNSPHGGPVTRIIFLFDDVIMFSQRLILLPQSGERTFRPFLSSKITILYNSTVWVLPMTDMACGAKFVETVQKLSKPLHRHSDYVKISGSILVVWGCHTTMKLACDAALNWIMQFTFKSIILISMRRYC